MGCLGLLADAGPGAALEVTTELLRSVRELTLQLRPRMLDDLGLQPALEWQLQLFRSQTGIGVELDLALPPARLDTELETTVFRMVQEALTNVARHSGATAAVVTVTTDDHSLQVEVADRGCGFDAATALARRDSLGLAGLAERVQLAGGHLEIVSQPGRGTRLHAEFTLAGRSESSKAPPASSPADAPPITARTTSPFAMPAGGTLPGSLHVPVSLA